MGERREGSKLSDLLTPTNLIVGASALAVIGVGAAIILSGRGKDDDDDDEDDRRSKKKTGKKKTKKEVRSKYEEEEVEAKPVAKKGAKAPAKAAPEASKWSYEEEETPGAPIERKPAAKKAAAAAAPAATSAKTAAAKAPAASASKTETAVPEVSNWPKLSVEEAQRWLRTYPSHQNLDLFGPTLLALGDAMAAKQKTLTEEDVEGDLELTFDRWFLTGFVAGLVRKHKDEAIEIIINILKVLPTEEVDELDTPGICFHGLIMSGSTGGIHLAFRLFLAQLPEDAFKGMEAKDAQDKASAQFEAFLQDFEDSSASYAVLTGFGMYHGSVPTDTPLLDKAMEILKEFYDNTEDEEGKDELFKGTKYAFQRFAFYSPSGATYLLEWARNEAHDEFSRNCVKEALLNEPAAPLAD